MSETQEVVAEPLVETPLTTHFGPSAGESVAYQGALTPRAFSNPNQELQTLTSAAGIYDLGYTARLQVSGGDRQRWLNGMVTNNIRDLAEGCWNYSFVLNSQGRIQGNLNAYRTTETFILETSRSQIAHLSAHLDHFIIMDDVELQALDAEQTAIGIAGPKAPEALTALGFLVPQEGTFHPVAFKDSDATMTLVHAHSPVVPRFELWLSAAALPQIWTALEAAGAVPCGATAVEALRVLEGTPLFGIDIQDRHLAQETSQTRALNFNKGCYLGQEIVERIRSRASVHRTLRQFAVENAPDSLTPEQPLELNAEGAERNPVGELTSLMHYDLPAIKGALALGFIRTEAVERNLPITHAGGTVRVLATLPNLS